MAYLCKHCGTELPEGCLACPECGELLMSRRKFKWWMAAIPAVLIVAILAVIFWQPILLAVAPEAALASAVVKTQSALNDLAADGPLDLLCNSVDYQQNFTTDISMTVGTNPSEEIRLDMSAAYDPAAKAMLSDMTLRIFGLRDMKMGAYADRECLALSLADFRNGAYLGTYYDSFYYDATKGDLLQLVDMSTLLELDNSLKELKQLLDMEHDSQQIAEPYIEIIRSYIAQLELSKSGGDLMLDGMDIKCSILSWYMNQEDILAVSKQLLAHLRQDPNALELFKQYEEYEDQVLSYQPTDAERKEAFEKQLDDAEKKLNETLSQADIGMTLAVYIYKGYVAAVSANGGATIEGKTAQLSEILSFGLQPGSSPIAVDAAITYAGETVSFHADVVTEKDETNFCRTVSVSVCATGEENVEIQLAVDWNKENGDLKLTLKQMDKEDIIFDCNLRAQDNGFLFHMDYAGEIPGDVTALNLSLTVGCQPGGVVAKPYIMTPQLWSKKVIQELMEAIGSLAQPKTND